MEDRKHNQGLPVKGKRSDAVPGRAAEPPEKGYQPQSNAAVGLVNSNKIAEERILRLMDEMKGKDDIDQRWLAIARTNIEQGFMALNRAVFRPERLELDGGDFYEGYPVARELSQRMRDDMAGDEDESGA